MRAGHSGGARAELVAVCRHLAAVGLSPGSSGNASVRLGDSVLVTPTGSSFSRLTPESLALVELSSGRSTSGPAPTKELPLHLAVYGARRDVGAVIHLHSPYATAVACLPPDADGHAALPPLTPYRVMRLGPVPVAPYAAPGSDELAAGVAALVAVDVLLLANHGSLVAARTLTAAGDLAEELETAAQVSLLVQDRNPQPLPADAVAALRQS